MNKIFKVSEKKLEEIVRKAVEEYLEAIKPKENNFRIEGDIPDISSLFKNAKFSDSDLAHKDNDRVDEGLIQTYDANKVKDIVCRKFNLLPEQFYIEPVTENGRTVELIAIVLDNKLTKNEVGDVINLMRTCGYFQYQQNRIYGKQTVYFFEPHFSKDITDEIKQNYQYLFHATPTIYVQKILNNGLVPRHRNTLYFYPSRVYCMLGNNLSAEQIHTLKNIRAERGAKRLHDNNQYTILRINVGEIPENVRFFVDPLGDTSILTHDNIPPNAISVYDEL